MGLESIEFNGKVYPSFQATGNAARWCRPFADEILKGLTHGLDIGYSKEEWKYPGSIGIEPSINPQFHAMNLPVYGGEGFDYIHSSHSLEHVKENWMNVLDYWMSVLRVGGILFLYLPHVSQEYWQTWSNRKHVHQFTGTEIADYLKSKGHKVFLSSVDLNNSFIVVAEKSIYSDSKSNDPKTKLGDLPPSERFTFDITGNAQ